MLGMVININVNRFSKRQGIYRNNIDKYLALRYSNPSSVEIRSDLIHRKINLTTIPTENILTVNGFNFYEAYALLA